ISEYKPEQKPHEGSFAARNRIVAGLSQAVLVIEAAERSGTSITTRLALDYNREVLAVPHPLGSETGSGTNTLIRQGAALI
ncbi:DNA-protecting protein DprA, partial [Staphylococcus aureus]|uniref:DNA-processing protein DprA n=1 Tax=Staphylococcus aureus TaxID=1280 RepID=UPI001E48C058